MYALQWLVPQSLLDHAAQRPRLIHDALLPPPLLRQRALLHTCQVALLHPQHQWCGKQLPLPCVVHASALATVS